MSLRPQIAHLVIFMTVIFMMVITISGHGTKLRIDWGRIACSGLHNQLVFCKARYTVLGRSRWNPTVDMKSPIELSFDFITEWLNLTVV